VIAATGEAEAGGLRIQDQPGQGYWDPISKTKRKVQSERAHLEAQSSVFNPPNPSSKKWASQWFWGVHSYTLVSTATNSSAFPPPPKETLNPLAAALHLNHIGGIAGDGELLWLAPFTHHGVFKVLPHWSMRLSALHSFLPDSPFAHTWWLFYTFSIFSHWLLFLLKNVWPKEDPRVTTLMVQQFLQGSCAQDAGESHCWGLLTVLKITVPLSLPPDRWACR
jgi:hypothetical protein